MSNQQGISSHLVSQLLSRDDLAHSPKSSIHTGGATSATDGHATGYGMGAKIGSMVGQSLSSLNLESPIPSKNIDFIKTTVGQGTLSLNPMDAFNGTFICPVASIDFAGHMSALQTEKIPQPKGFGEAVNAGIEGKTALISPPQQGQSH